MAIKSSAVSRIPTEIWWMIFELVISAPFFFATLYEGDNWAVEAVTNFLSPGWPKDFQQSIRNRKSIGCVCKSWRRFAESRRYQYLNLGQFFHNASSALPSPDVIARARSISAQGGIGTDRGNLKLFSKGVQWEIATVQHVHLRSLAEIPHRQLKRLETTASFPEGSPPKDFIQPLKGYQSLTWLRLRLDLTPALPLFAGRRADATKLSLKLPHLQVLIYHVTNTSILDTFDLVLPKLRHILLCKSSNHPSTFSFEPLLSPYRRTLQSIAIGAATESPPPRKPQFFPPWSDFPKLEELALDPAYRVEFHPFPSTHPVRRIFTPQWNLKSLYEWLESDHLQKIRLLGAKWGEDGSLDAGAARSISKKDIDDVLAKAKAKNVVIEIGCNWISPALSRNS